MFRSNLRQGVTAVVFVAALGVASAQPAAAAELGWRQAWDWLSGLWGGVTQLQPLHSLHPATAADTVNVGPGTDPSGSPTTNGDCGLEIDPNGGCRPTGT